MKRKNFNFDVMQSKVSEGIKLTNAQNEYALNCYDIIFGSHCEDADSEKENTVPQREQAIKELNYLDEQLRVQG